MKERSRIYTVGYYILLAGISLCLLMIFLQSARVNFTGRALYPAMIDGTAYRPFVGRALVPILTNGIVRMMPVAEETFYQGMMQQEFGNWILAAFYASNGTSRAAIVTAALMWLSLCMAGIVLQKLLQYFVQAPYWFIDSMALLALGTIALIFDASFIYDYTTLATFALAYYLLALRAWYPYLLVLFFATINRETTLLLILFFALWGHDALYAGDRRRYWGLLLAQIGLYGLVRGGLFWIFRNNLGVAFDWNFEKNLVEYAAHPAKTLIWISIFVAVVTLLVSGWRRYPRFLQRSLLLGPPLFVLYLLIGWAYEIRVFYEISPMLAVAFALLLNDGRSWLLRAFARSPLPV